MKIKKNSKNITIQRFNINDFSNLDLKKLNLIESPLKGIYLYQSKGYKIFKWEIKPKIFIKIIRLKDSILLSIEDIKGIGYISNYIEININTSITQKLDSLEINRKITIKFKEKPNYLKFISDEIFDNFIDSIFLKIVERFDKKLIKKIKTYR